MSARAKLITAVIILCVIGGGVAAYKTKTLGVPFWKDQRVSEWLIEAKLSFVAAGGDVDAKLALPERASTENAGQEVSSLVYDYHVKEDKGSSFASWSARGREDAQALYYRLRFSESLDSGGEPVYVPNVPAPDTPFIPGSTGDVAKDIVSRLKSVTRNPDSLFVRFLSEINKENLGQEYALVRKYYEKEYGLNANSAMAVDMLGLAGVPARLAHGIHLDESRIGVPAIPLIEYYDGSAWKVRDPARPTAVLDGRKTIVWQRGGDALFEVNGGENSKLSFSVKKDRIPLSRLTDLRDSPFFIATILALPMAEQAVFRYIVLIPLGAFIVVLMRNLVGIPTLGTFMPVLLALALLEISPVKAIIMFSVLIGAGLWFRFLLSRMNLLVVPRVAACVVIVTLLMILMGVISSKLGFSVGIKITLFPMIIIAWTLERMSLIWEEEGKRSAIVQVGGSVVVAVFAWFFMRIEQIQYWVFYFPETLLILLAIILLVGRYTGYRISELIRFKTFENT